MKVLLDQNLSRRMRARMPGHLVVWAGTVSWGQLENGDLIETAERNDFEVMVTADQNIYYQQNNEKRAISLVVLSTNYWAAILKHMDEITAAVARAFPGSYEEVDIPPVAKPTRN